MAIKVQGTTVIDDSRNLQNSVNLNATGNMYANTFIGDGSQLTNLPPSGGTVTAIASGTLSDGSAVIVNADGTVSTVVATAVDASAGTASVFNAGAEDISAVYDPDSQKVVIAYEDLQNSRYGTAVVGTVSGTSISFGTPVVFESTRSDHSSIAYDANAQKIVIAYRKFVSGYPGHCVVGTVSGTSISFGSPVTYAGGSSNAVYTSVVYDANAQKIVIAYKRAGYGYEGFAIVGTVSGTSISFGTAVAFSSGAASDISAVYDTSAQKIVISYRDDANSDYGTAIVGTVSGTSISFGTAVVFQNSYTGTSSAVYESNAQKIVISYRQAHNNDSGTAIVGTVSGTSISFGTAVVFDTDVGLRSVGAIAYNASEQKVVIAYQDVNNSRYGTAIEGTVSGTSISFGTPFVFENARSNDMTTVYDASAGKVAIAYGDDGNSDSGTGVVFSTSTTSTNLTSSNYLGISNDAYANNTTATVQVAGSVDDAQSGLTPGQTYYVQANGSIGTTAGSPSVIAGTAVAATKLLVKG